SDSGNGMTGVESDDAKASMAFEPAVFGEDFMRMQAAIGVRTLVRGLVSRGGGRGKSQSGAVPRGNERGIALISVLLIMSLLLMLGLAVTFTSVSDKFITSNYKNMMSGF